MEQDREYYLSSLSSHIFSAESVAQSLLSYILISGMHNLLFTLHFLSCHWQHHLNWLQLKGHDRLYNYSVYEVLPSFSPLFGGSMFGTHSHVKVSSNSTEIKIISCNKIVQLSTFVTTDVITDHKQTTKHFHPQIKPTVLWRSLNNQTLHHYKVCFCSWSIPFKPYHTFYGKIQLEVANVHLATISQKEKWNEERFHEALLVLGENNSQPWEWTL